MTDTITVTVREVFEALKKNGFEWGRDIFIKEGEGKLIACALGQAALNLGVVPFSPFPEGIQTKRPWTKGTRLSLESQLDKFIVKDESKIIHEETKLGRLIEFWNDERVYTDMHKHRLKTYEEMVEVARELMEPFFDEEITLSLFDTPVETWFENKGI